MLLDDLTVTQVVIALVLLFAVLVCRYPDRPIGVSPRPSGIASLEGGWPLLGNVRWLLSASSGRKQLLELLRTSQEEVGAGGKPWTAAFPALGGRVTIINNPAYLQYVQKTAFEKYPKGSEFHNNMSDTLGESSIFISDGPVWSTQRKLASNIFSVSNFKSHVQSSVLADLHKLDQLLSHAAETQTSVQLPDLFFRFTLSSFSAMAFNADLDCLPTEVQGLQIANDFATNFDFAQTIMDRRFVTMLPRIAEWFTPEGWRMRRSLRALKRFSYGIISARLETRSKGQGTGATNKAGKDLLELFMDQGLKKEDLFPVVISFLIAGRDTTAQSVAWLFYELSQHTEHVEKIRASLLPVLGSPEEQRPLAYEDYRSLPYLQACIYEAIRLWPAVPKNMKKIAVDDVIQPIPVADSIPLDLPPLPVKAGESVMWSDWCMARMPEVWGEDCLEYKPERFLTQGSDGSLLFREYSPWQFHAFNAGPRLCLGKTLATYEAMAVTAAILGRYDVVYEADLKKEPPTYQDSLTLPCSPYFVKFRLRESS